MVKRPLGKNRPFGPFIEVGAEDKGSSKNIGQSDKTETDGVLFDSVDDLPESEMLHDYVSMMIEKTGQPERAVINSKPVEKYMKKLGVWKYAVKQNNDT